MEILPFLQAVPINWRVTSFEVDYFEVFKKPKKLADFVNGLQFEFTSTQHFESIEKDHILILKLNVSVFNDLEKKVKVATMDSTTAFEIVNYAESIGVLNGIPMNLVVQALITHISTVRGAYYVKTQGTYLEGSIVPTIGVNHLINETPAV